MIFAVMFVLTLRPDKKTIILELAEKQGKVDKEQVDEDLFYYFTLLTKVWVGYFLSKSALYTYLGFNFNYEDTKLFRLIFGNISFYFLLGLTMFGGKLIYRLLDTYQALPSYKVKSQP